MNMLNHFSGTRFARLHHHAALLGSALLLLGASFAAHADEVQDANKLFKQGQHSQALDKVNTFLGGKPKDAQARFLKGLILTEQGKTGDAIKIFSTLTEDYPELPEPYNNLAVLYAGQGQYDKAKQSLEMAIRTHPSYATAHENLGDIYAKMASQAYDRALQLDRSNTATQTKLAMIQDLFADGSRGKAAARSSSAPIGATTGKTEPVKTALSPVVAAATAPAPVSKAAPTEKVAPPAATAPAATLVSGASPAARTNNSKEVLKTLDAWAAAWSAKNVKKYLSFYATDFKTPGGETRAAWEATRNERISKPKTIHIGIKGTSVAFTDENHATLKFHQIYQAGPLKISGDKTMLLVKTGDRWLIHEERAK